MKRTKQCPKCGSGDIISGATPVSSAEYNALRIATMGKPAAVIFKTLKTSPVSAWVCADCGYLELYADDPKGIQI